MTQQLSGTSRRLSLKAAACMILSGLFFWATPLSASKDDDLLKAAREGRLSEAQAALVKGANPNAKDKSGETALIKASFGDGEIVKLLLSKGANPNLKRDDGITALDIASSNGHHVSVLALIAAGADVNHSDSRGRTALMSVAEHADQLAVQALLARGAEPGATHQDGRTALDFGRVTVQGAVQARIIGVPYGE